MLNKGSDDDGMDDLVTADCTVPKQWKPPSLAILFDGQKEPHDYSLRRD